MDVWLLLAAALAVIQFSPSTTTTTTEPATTGPATTGPTTPVPATTEPTTPEPATTGPATPGPATTGPATTEPTTPGPTTPGPATTGPATPGPATTGPATTGLTTTGPTTPVPATTGPTTPGLTTTGPTQITTTTPTTIPLTGTPSMSTETTSTSPTETTSTSPTETTSTTTSITTTAVIQPTETITTEPTATTALFTPTTTEANTIPTTPTPDPTTSQPAETTTQPAETTTQPAETTSQPAETTSQPAETTTQPAETTSQPAETTSQPAETTTQPAETTSQPAETTSQPAETPTTTQPAETTTQPAETTSQPAETTTQPAETTTTTQPAETTSQPAETTTTTQPAETTTTTQPAVPTTTEAPNSTTLAPDPPPTTAPATTTSPAPPTITTTSPAPPTTTTTTSPAPPTTTTATPPTTTPLVCLNGGVLQGGVCVCQDQWTGPTCFIENFCKAQPLEGRHFLSTPIGWFAYSVEVCPPGSISAGKPQASTRCSNATGSAAFELPLRILNCEETLGNIQQNLTDAADLEALASSTQLLTSRPEELTAENVTTAAQIANTLLLSPNATEEVRVAVVATVSQLLSAPDDTEENNATLRLTLTLDQLSVNLSSTLNTSQSQVVQPNLVVQSAQVVATDTRGVQFTSLTGASGSFVANRIQLNTNASAVEVGHGFTADALVFVRLPPGSVSGRQEASPVSLGFVLYQNDNFFRSRRYRSRRATVRILSATVRGRGRRVVPQHVELQFRPALPNGTSLHDFACVFWDYGVGDWSTAGCSKGNASGGVLTCFCNHTTNFAALWSFRENYQYSKALDGISITGLSLSLLGLVVTIIYHIKDNFQWRSRQNQNARMTLLSVYVSLLAFIITFLSGVQNYHRADEEPTASQANDVPESDEYVAADRGPCTAVAALLHFFLLATFTWNAVYGTQLLLLVLVRPTRTSLPPRCSGISAAVGWGAPAVVMAITLGATYRPANPLGYRQEEFCWLSGLDRNKRFSFGRPLFWGFVLPVGLILVYNTVLLVLTALTICRTDQRLTRTNPSTVKKFLTCFSLAVILGVSWSLGYLVLVTTGTAHLVFSILFCLCTTTQGLQIFVLFTARKASFKASVSRAVWAATATSYRLHRMWTESKSSESYKDLGVDRTATSSM